MSEKQTTGHSKKSRREQWKDRLGGLVEPGWLGPLSRGHSRPSSRVASPVPSPGKADNASTTAGASSYTPEICLGVGHDTQLVAGANATIPAIKLDGKLDDRLDDRLDVKSNENQNVESDDDENAELGAAMDGSQDQENENADTADSAQENDMWKIAEAQLRQDKNKKKLLDAYYDILKFKLKEDLEPAGTPERQKQISAFIVSESMCFHETSKLGKFSSVLKKAAKCILKAEQVISTAAQPCLPASIACAGVMLVLSVSSSLRLLTPGSDAQIALCSSQQSAGRSPRRPG
jgi:hypothetical protein